MPKEETTKHIPKPSKNLLFVVGGLLFSQVNILHSSDFAVLFRLKVELAAALSTESVQTPPEAAAAAQATEPSVDPGLSLMRMLMNREVAEGRGSWRLMGFASSTFLDDSDDF